ncbi:MAG: hypothetical protein AAFZ01_12515 [Pseudomonadota bacterium]
MNKSIVVTALLVTAIAVSACRREAPVMGFGAPAPQTEVAQ